MDQVNHSGIVTVHTYPVQIITDSTSQTHQSVLTQGGSSTDIISESQLVPKVQCFYNN